MAKRQGKLEPVFKDFRSIFPREIKEKSLKIDSKKKKIILLFLS